MKNDAIIKSILCLLKGYKDEKEVEPKQQKNLNSIRYLLNQSIREYDIPDMHRHVSEKATELWSKIMPKTEDIKNYHYKQMVDCKNLSTNEVNLDLYKGASQEPYNTQTLQPGKEFKFEFRKVFHEEHVIPVKAIVDKLIEQKNNIWNEQSIKELLDKKLHICIILKEENARLPKTKRKSFDYQEIIDKIYEKVAKITLV